MWSSGKAALSWVGGILRYAFWKASALLLAIASLFCPADTVFAHPHIFVDAHLTVFVTPEQQVERLEQSWQFDPSFSSGVMHDFDKDGDLKLNEAELAEISKTIRESLAEYDFFQSVIKDGRRVVLNPPTFIKTGFRDKKFVISFSVTPKEKLVLEKGHKYNFSLYDPTFYVAVHVPESQNFSVSGLPPACRVKFIRPDIDKALSRDFSQEREDFFDDLSRSSNLAWSIAARLEISCP